MSVRKNTRATKQKQGQEYFVRLTDIHERIVPTELTETFRRHLPLPYSIGPEKQQYDEGEKRFIASPRTTGNWLNLANLTPCVVKFSHFI